jgi:hypothetical protein
MFGWKTLTDIFSPQRRRERREIIFLIPKPRVQPIRSHKYWLMNAACYLYDTCRRQIAFLLSTISVESKKKNKLCDLCASAVSTKIRIQLNAATTQAA